MTPNEKGICESRIFIDRPARTNLIENILLKVHFVANRIPRF